MRHPHLSRPLAALAVAVMVALLTACGGGGEMAATGNDADILDADTAPGYSADAATMPVNAAAGLDNAAAMLESALADAVAPANSRARALAAAPQAVETSVSADCPGGGSITWSISGATSEQLQNHRFDAGETYSVVYAGCTSLNADAVLDGRLTLFVVARSDTEAAFNLDAVGLNLTTSQGQHTLDGSAQSQRSIVASDNGGHLSTSHFNASALRMATRISGRQASYDLRSLDWSVARTLNASGALTARTHNGSVDLAVNTFLRPAGSLQVASLGDLTIADDGLARSGSLSIATARNALGVVYGANTVTVNLDLGNNGSIDRTWTFSRAAFHGDAG